FSRRIVCFGHALSDVPPSFLSVTRPPPPRRDGNQDQIRFHSERRQKPLGHGLPLVALGSNWLPLDAYLAKRSKSLRATPRTALGSFSMRSLMESTPTVLSSSSSASACSRCSPSPARNSSSNTLNSPSLAATWPLLRSSTCSCATRVGNNCATSL